MAWKDLSTEIAEEFEHCGGVLDEDHGFSFFNPEESLERLRQWRLDNTVAAKKAQAIRDRRRQREIKADPERYAKSLETSRERQRRRAQVRRADPEQYGKYLAYYRHINRTRYEALRADPVRYAAFLEAKRNSMSAFRAKRKQGSSILKGEQNVRT